MPLDSPKCVGRIFYFVFLRILEPTNLDKIVFWCFSVARKILNRNDIGLYLHTNLFNPVSYNEKCSARIRLSNLKYGTHIWKLIDVYIFDIKL